MATKTDKTGEVSYNAAEELEARCLTSIADMYALFASEQKAKEITRIITESNALTASLAEGVADENEDIITLKENYDMQVNQLVSSAVSDNPSSLSSTYLIRLINETDCVVDKEYNIAMIEFYMARKSGSSADIKAWLKKSAASTVEATPATNLLSFSSMVLKMCFTQKDFTTMEEVRAVIARRVG